MTERDPFESISRRYHALQRRAAAAIFRVQQEKYYPRCVDASVLDIGNGGQPVGEVMGERIARSLTRFVGVDASLAMLRRTERPFSRVAGDGLDLPFRDGAFDYVIVNGVFHHLGFETAASNRRRVQRLVREALRVCGREVIVYEPFTPVVLERLERLAARMLGGMPTFMLSEPTFDGYVRELGLCRREVETKTLAALTGPFAWQVVMMEHPWLRLPAVLSPFRHAFFVIPKP